jgi:CelD/BcsL family acetyltransferase involved in cellulose biosynthesis
MTLPDSLEAFMQRLRPKHRSEIRRNERLFEKAFPGRIEHRIVRQRKDVPQLCQDLEAVARFTYQRGLGVGFFDNAEHRRRMALAADKSWLRAYLIYIDQQPIAFEVGMLYGSTFHLYFTGYHQDFRKHEPGTVVFMRMVDDLCRAGIQEVDCGAGDAIYKAYYGDSKSMEGSVFMFAPCLRGLRLNAARTLTLGVSRLAGALGRRAGLYQKFKKRWRMRVAPSAAGPLKT